ncbi:MAG: transglycosylase domain-containing protein [Bacteroidales bacterium]|nr:transglycosylase domain-containing protein [Bacteroidales bacterium]
MQFNIQNKHQLWRSVWKTGGIALAGIVLFSAMFCLLVVAGGFGKIPGKKELSEIRNEEASLVYSSDNVLIGKYFAENRTNISREEMPGHLVDALIATEDRRFYSHNGYDSRSYLRVFLRTIVLGDRSSGGGSTITQQLVKNLYGREDHGRLSLPVNKLRELIIAKRMENLYTKDELLTLYLNSVPFGEEVYGVESAARRFFSKPAAQLGPAESAVLVGMLKANTRYNPRIYPENALERRNVVLRLMAGEGYLDEAVADSLMEMPMDLAYENLDLANPAGYFVYQVKKQTEEILQQLDLPDDSAYNLETDGLRIFTTLNMRLQEISLASVRNHLPGMQTLLDRELEQHGEKERWQKSYSKNMTGTNESGQRSGERDASGSTDEIGLQPREHDASAFADESGQLAAEGSPAESTGKFTTETHPVNLFSWEGIVTRELSSIDSAWYYESMLNASVLITEPSTGAVKAWIGGNNYRFLPFDMVLSHRQSASVFKPFVYATALEYGTSPCTYLENKAVVYEGRDGQPDWEPGNADHTETPDSTVAAWYALAHSMNLPTLDLYFRMDTSDLQETCKKLGFPAPPGDAPSVALGTLDLSLFEITRAYSSFANNGQMQEPVIIEMITDADDNILYRRKPEPATTVFSEKTSQTITAMLEKAVDEGTGTRIRTGYGITSDLAGKTGTAQNYSDSWFIGYTPELVLSTWVGARSPSIHFHSSLGSGSSLALPIVAGILREMEQNDNLAQNYLLPFGLPEKAYASIDCEPFRQKGLRGFFQRIFGSETEGNTAQEADSNDATDQPGRENPGDTGKNDKRPSLLERIFRKRDHPPVNNP